MAGQAGLHRIVTLLQAQVAAAAGDHGLLPVGLVLGVAGAAGGLGLVGGALGGQGLHRFAVAGAAQGGRDIGGISQGLGRVRLMTGPAVTGPHPRPVGLVALVAGLGLAVDRVAFIAVHGAVGALARRNDLSHLGMTGETGRPHRVEARQIHLERLVGRVAGAAAAESEVTVFRRGVAPDAWRRRGSTLLGMVGMAVAAAGRGVPGMAIETVQACLMAPARPHQLLHRLAVAGGAQLLVRGAGEIDRQRRVGRVAGAAVLSAHGRTVGLVAFQAGEYLLVALVAPGAAHLGMGAGVGFGLPLRLGMTAGAGGGEAVHLVPGPGQRGVGLVAASAVFQREMGFIAWRVAVGAVWDRALLGRMALVAVGTAEPFVVGTALSGEGSDGILMTGGAEGCRNISLEPHGPRRVWAMAAQAVHLGHGRGVGLMAVAANGALAMLQVAVVAGHAAVALGRGRHLLSDGGVTGKAGRGQVGHIVQVPALGGMGLVAGAAIGQGEMAVFPRGVAAVAAGRSAPRPGGMFAVTAEAADLALMGRPLLLEDLDGLLMTGGAPVLGNTGPVADRQRLVGSMAGLAVGGRHGGVMGLVAIGAGG